MTSSRRFQKVSPFDFRKTVLLFITGMIALFDTSNSVAIIPAMAEMSLIFNWHELEIAAILSIYFLGAIISLLPIGFLLDRNPHFREHVLLGGFGIFFVSTIIFHLSMDVIIGMILARAIMGIANSTMRISTFAIIAEEYPDHRGLANALVMMFMGAGAVLGFLFGGLLWSTIFFWIAISSLPLIIVFIIFLAMMPPRHATVGTNISFSLAAKIIPRTNILAAIGPLAFLTFVLGIGITIYPRFTRDILGIDPQTTNIAIGIALLLFSLLLPLFGHLSDRYGRKPFILMSMISTGILLPLVVAPQNATIFFYGLILVGSIQSGLMAAADPLLMDSIENELLKLGRTDIDLFGIAGTLRSLAWGLGFVIGPILAGILITFLSIPMMAIIIGVSCLIWTMFVHKGTIDWKNVTSIHTPAPTTVSGKDKT